MTGYKTLDLASAPTQRDEDTGADWITLRHQLGVTAFGVNAWRAPEAGQQVIVEHDEADSLHQEIYVVVDGHATFTIDGDEIDAPAGTVVFIDDPTLRRVGIAEEPGTTVLAVGARPGVVFAPSTWEAELVEGSGG